MLFLESSLCVRARVRHIMFVNSTIMLFSITLKIVPLRITQKIILVSDHYARVMLGEISPLNPRYNTQISPQSLKRNILMLFFTLKGEAK